MGKIIKYQFLSCQINHGTEEDPVMEDVLLEKKIKCTSDTLKTSEEIARREAYNGEYTITDEPIEEE